MSSNLIYSPSAARVLNAIPSNEHTAGDRTPYCYLIGWTEQNLWYYGRRTERNCHPSEFWKKYFTSCGASNNSKIQTAIHPGDYKIGFIAKGSKGAQYTDVQYFKIQPGVTTMVKLFNK